MASTTFNGPVRSEKGFQVATKNTTTGAVTTRMSSAMPDLTGLAKADVATGASLTLAADTMSIVNYTGAAAAGCTLPQLRREQLLFTFKQKIQQVELIL